MLTLVTPPAVEPLTLEEAKLHLRVQSSIEDATIHALMKAAREHIDGRDGWLGKALITQSWDLKLDGFVTPIRIPLPPLQAVESVSYVDPAGAEQTLLSEAYQVSGVAGADKAEIRPAFGKTWPQTQRVPEAVTVRFRAGYGDVGSDVPEPVRAALLLLLGHWYEHREAVITGTIPAIMPMTVNYLLMPYRTVPGIA